MPDSSAEQILYFLKSRGPQTTGAVAVKLRLSQVGARKHLQNLQSDGLIRFEDRREQVGRPKRYWSLTQKGHARFPDAHADLTLDLIESVRAVFGESGLEQLIRDREKGALRTYLDALSGCADLKQRVSKLSQMRSAEGYMAEWSEEGGGSFLLAENHCPVCAAATLCQGLCRSELAMFRRVLGEDASVERVDHILAGARRCAYRIAPRTGHQP